MSSWSLRAPVPPLLVRPVRVDPSGRHGPTKSQAAGARWRRTSPGYFVPTGTDRGVVEQRILEESVRLPPTGAVTGWAALRMHGVGYLDGRDPGGEVPVPLVVPPGTGLRVAPGAVLHRERLEPQEIVLRYGVPVTDPTRAAFDAARRAADVRAAVQVLDLALSSGVLDRDSLARTLPGRAGWPGLRQVLAAIGLAEDRCMSPAESSLRMIWMLDAGLPAPRCNWPVADDSGRFIGRPDLLSEELAVVGEYDGALHRSRQQHREDLRRDEAFRSVGLEPFRVVGADLGDRDLVLARIASAIERAARNSTRAWLVKARPGPVR